LLNVFIHKILFGISDFKRSVSALKHTPRWLVLFFELYIVSVAFLLNYLLIKSSKFDYSGVMPLYLRYCIYISTIGISFVFFGTHRASIRFTGITDIIRLSISVMTAAFGLTLLNYVSYYIFNQYIFSFIPLFYAIILSITFLILSRLVIKFAYLQYSRPVKTKLKNRFLMLGTQGLNLSTAKNLNSIPNSDIRVSGYISFDPTLQFKNIAGIPVITANNLYAGPEKCLKNISGIIMLDLGTLDRETENMLDFLMACKMQIYTIQTTSILEYDPKKELTLKKVEIEDSLFREPIAIHTDKVSHYLAGSKVLITGAAGSIGSELVRQICSFSPAHIIMLDFAETPLFYLEQEIYEKYPQLNCTAILGNILDKESMEALFDRFQPEIVFHAAAYKHVPMMEKNPEKSFWVNLMGSRYIVDFSMQYGVKRMVQVSTDKAVNPTNIMGLTKRLAELYLQSVINIHPKQFSNDFSTQYVITRFGNVLGSNGSVIPIFRKQIQDRKPITITDPLMTRYFMTIPEASSLVLQAGTTGQSGEIFIFDMGQPVKIIDMAHRLIRLSGLEPGKDIEIKITGKRPGEKLYEELFNENCVTTQTNHPKIFKVVENGSDIKKQLMLLQSLFIALKNQDLNEVMRIAQELVPEFQHENAAAVKVS